MSYPVLSALFLGAAVIFLGVVVLSRADRKALLRAWALPWLGAAAVLLVLTAIFDNVMITVGLMEYEHGLTAGVRIGLVPIEDFSYPIAALCLLPTMWLLLSREGNEDVG